MTRKASLEADLSPSLGTAGNAARLQRLFHMLPRKPSDVIWVRTLPAMSALLLAACGDPQGPSADEQVPMPDRSMPPSSTPFGGPAAMMPLDMAMPLAPGGNSMGALVEPMGAAPDPVVQSPPQVSPTDVELSPPLAEDMAPEGELPTDEDEAGEQPLAALADDSPTADDVAPEDAPGEAESTDETIQDPDVDPEPDDPAQQPEGSNVDDEPASEVCNVQPLNDEFRRNYDNLDPFYQKYADADGLPIVSSLEPDDEALTRACLLVIDMLSARPDVRDALIDNYVRFVIIAESELTNDPPEFSYLPDSINQRARGLGSIPAVSCAEESILCHRDLDPWRGEGICVHEFAHTISMAGIYEADPTFEQRLIDAYDAARGAGLFDNTYAAENPQEYWAEGVQNWYYTNLEASPPNGIHNHVDTREEMLEYDPVLYELIAEFFPDEPQFVDCYSDEDDS